MEFIVNKTELANLKKTDLEHLVQLIFFVCVVKLINVFEKRFGKLTNLGLCFWGVEGGGSPS